MTHVGSEHIRAFGKRIAVALVAYSAGYLATALVFLFTNGSGIEGTANDSLPYYAGFAALYGAALGWWWLVPFPFLHLYIVEPIWNEVRSEGPVYYAYDRPGYVLAGTLGIVAGVLLHTLIQRTRFNRASSEHE